MMIDAFLDSSIIIDLQRKFPRAIQWWNKNPKVKFGIASISQLEILNGVQGKIHLIRTRRFLQQFGIEYLDEDDQRWATTQLTTYRLSHGIGYADCLIAAVAQRLQLPLYTINMKHFRVLIPTLAQKPY